MAKTKLIMLELLLASINAKLSKRKLPLINFLSKSYISSYGWVSTGFDLLDKIISNTTDGGLPLGRITEFSGLLQSGKSFIAAHTMKNVQQMGGIAVYFDVLCSADRNFMKQIGVNDDKLFYIDSMNTVLDVFDTMLIMITSVKEKSKDTPMVIVVDSIAALSTRKLMEGNYLNDTGYGTLKAKLLGKVLRKMNSLINKYKIGLLLINQLRLKMNAMPFADPYTTPGGRAIPFWSSLRVRFSSGNKIKDEKTKELIGIYMSASTRKNRLAPPRRTVLVPLYYLHGMDNLLSWYLTLKKFEVIKDNKYKNGLLVISLRPSLYKKVITNRPLVKEIFKKLILKLMLKLYSFADDTIPILALDLLEDFADNLNGYGLE